MREVVCFETARGSFAIPVEQVRHVFPATELAELPDPLPSVVGLLRPGAEALPVLAVLGEGDAHVLHLDDGERQFGLMVAEVTGVLRLDADVVLPAPEGQREELVTGVVQADDRPRLLVDARTLAGRLRDG